MYVAQQGTPVSNVQVYNSYGELEQGGRRKGGCLKGMFKRSNGQEVQQTTQVDINGRQSGGTGCFGGLFRRRRLAQGAGEVYNPQSAYVSTEGAAGQQGSRWRFGRRNPQPEYVTTEGAAGQQGSRCGGCFGRRNPQPQYVTTEGAAGQQGSRWRFGRRNQQPEYVT